MTKHEEQMTDAALVSTATPSTPAIELRSAHDFALVTAALEHRSADLDKLAKKNEEEGYSKEARAVRADVQAISAHILPQFRAQPELPLVTMEALERQVLGKVSVHVARAFRSLDDPKVVVGEAEIQRRKEHLVKTLAERITLFAVDVAREAWQQGRAAREMTEEAIAAKQVSALGVADA